MKRLYPLLVILFIIYWGCEDKQEKDCAEVEGGTAVIDCKGDCGGTAEVDSCGLCTGGLTGVLPNYLKDCSGECGGHAEVDICGVCVGGTTGLLPNYLKDCAGVCGGTAIENDCGCVLGSTGLDENYCFPVIVSDFDGNEYETVQIGTQRWMAENLKVTHYNDGDEIPTGYTNEEWTELSTGAYAIYDDYPFNEESYGNLYNWYAVDDERGLCPESWHVPSDDEIMQLEMYLGMSQEDADLSFAFRGTNEGGMLKEGGTLHWDSEMCGEPECPDGSTGCNCSGFSALAGGYRDFFGAYQYMGYWGYFWSSTQKNNFPWFRKLEHNKSEILRSQMVDKQVGLSVRCVKDSSTSL